MNSTAPPFISISAGKDIDGFMNRVEHLLNEELLNRPFNEKAAQAFRNLFDELMSTFRSDDKFSEALEKLQKKSTMILAQPVLALLKDSSLSVSDVDPTKVKTQAPNHEAKINGGEDEGLSFESEVDARDGVISIDANNRHDVDGLHNDEELATAIIVLDKSQSLNELCKEIYARKETGSSAGDVFKVPMEKLVIKAIYQIELRAQLLVLGIHIPDNNMVAKNHWAKDLFAITKTVAAFRNLEAEMFDQFTERSDLNMAEKGKLERLYSGEIGSQRDVEYVPKIRKEFRKAKIAMALAGRFEKKGITSASEIGEVEDADISTVADPTAPDVAREKKSSLNSLRNKIFAVSAVTKAKEQESGGKDDEAASSAEGEKEDEADASADKIDERENEIKENIERMRAREEKSSEQMAKAKALINDLDLSSAEENKDKLIQKMDELKSHVEASERHLATGKNFRGQAALIDDLTNGTKNLRSDGPGVIVSYRNNQQLVAAVSGGKALHGLCVLVDDRAVIPGAAPLLKIPEFVEMFGVTQPFESKTFKTTSETESSSFEKTASSGSITIAESSSKAVSGSMGGSYGGFSGEISGGVAKKEESSNTGSSENKEDSESNRKSSTAFMYEYIKMPMRSFRIPYTSMRLSEDAKDSVMKIATERGAKEFLITYGTHLPFGIQTLGGIFTRKIYMQTSEEVESSSIFSAAGNTMSNEKSSSVTASASASYSAFGSSVSASASAESASKSGSTRVSTKVDSNGETEASTNSFYTLTVSSLGPNATDAENFFEQLSTNTGTWSIIDRGGLDQVRPVWELIEDEMLEDERATNRMNRSEKEIKIRRAIRLLRSVWGKHASLRMNTKTAPYMPSAITRSIRNFLAVENAIGAMVDAICTVVIPTPSKGGRLEMLQDLKVVVELAKDSFLGVSTFEYDNWWIKRFLELGMDGYKNSNAGSKMDPSVTKELAYTFDNVETNKGNLTNSNQLQSMIIRKAHAQAAEAAKELDEDGWEQFVERFVPLAKLSGFRNFNSDGDEQRVAKVWHITDGNSVNGNSVTLKTPITSFALKPMKSQEVICADAITPLTIKAIPPSRYVSFSFWWRVFTMLYIPNSFEYEIRPGSTYYWLRRKKAGYIRKEIMVTEESLLAEGNIIIVNPYPISLKASISGFDAFPNKSYELLGDSVLVLQRGTRGKDQPQNSEYVAVHEEEGTAKIELLDPKTGNANTSKDCIIKSGQKFMPIFEREDAFSLNAPTLESQSRKPYFDRLNRGSLLVSSSGNYQRLHQWKRGADECVLNGIKNDYKQFCLDQFWSLIPASPPDIENGEYYDPLEQCYLITSKKSESRVFALPDVGGDGTSAFGLVESYLDVEDCQKWQFLEDEQNRYEIVNVFSGHRLGIQRSDGKDEVNPIVATDPDTHDNYEHSQDIDDIGRHRWFVIPWESFKGNETDPDYSDPTGAIKAIKSVSRSLRILPRQTLPDNYLLENGGIIIHNKYSVMFRAGWGGGQSNKMISFKTRGDLKSLINTPTTAETKLKLMRTDSFASKDYDVTRGKPYHLYYDESDIICEGLPTSILTGSEFEKKVSDRSGFILVQSNLKYRIGTWTSKNVHGLAFENENNKFVPANECWDFVPGSQNNEFAIVNKEGKCLVEKNLMVQVDAFDSNSIQDFQTWIITKTENSNVEYYIIKSKNTSRYLNFTTQGTDGFSNVKTELVLMSTDGSGDNTSPPKFRIFTPNKLKQIVAGIQLTSNTLNPDKGITLMNAIALNRRDLVQLLLWDGVAPEKLSNGFIKAASTGKVKILEYMAENSNVDVNVTDDTGGTALHAAAAANQLESVEKLIELGCDKGKENNNLDLPWDLSTDDNVKTLLHFKLKAAEVHPIKFISAEQSSTYKIYRAEIAINGIIDTAFTHTNWERNPWWKGKLQVSTIITKIVISNRFSGNNLDLRDRIKDFHLIIEKNGVEVYRDDSHGTESLTKYNIDIPNIEGDTVKVELPGDSRILSLAEVVVSAPMHPVVFKEAKQSSLWASKHIGEWLTADKAINGDKTGDIISCTKLEANPWWEVKLRRTFAVSKVVIYNRTIGQERLQNFMLIIQKGDDVIYISNTHGTAVSASYDIDIPNIEGDLIRIELTGNSRILSLLEVEVYTPIVPY